MTDPAGAGPVSPLDALIVRLRGGETLDDTEIRRLRSELTKRAEQNDTAIGRAGGMDAKTAKKHAARHVAEVRRAGMAQARHEDGE